MNNKDILNKIDKWWNELQNGDTNKYNVVWAEVTYDDIEELKSEFRG